MRQARFGSGKPHTSGCRCSGAGQWLANNHHKRARSHRNKLAQGGKVNLASGLYHFASTLFVRPLPAVPCRAVAGLCRHGPTEQQQLQVAGAC
jgi:hypothetical protein